VYNNKEKSNLRKEFLKIRLSFDKEKLEKFSKIICEKIKAFSGFKKAEKILFYYPIKNEVNILSLLEISLKNKRIFLPRIYKNNQLKIHQVKSIKELEIGKYKIPEPLADSPIIDISKIDLILIPGIVFSKKLDRIGYGGGYYDRLLKNTKSKKIALAYNFQILDNILGENHDQKVDMIITEKEIRTISNS